MKVLIVDDEQALTRMMDRILRHLGHAPVTASRGDEALRLIDDVDAVITDIDMPGMDGVTLARRIRAAKPDVPIAFCSGSDPGEEIVTEAATIGPVMAKGWRLHEIQGLLRKLSPKRPGSQGDA